MQVRCPFCLSRPHNPCLGNDGRVLQGSHFQRVKLSRNAVQAALGYYAGLGLRAKGEER